MAGFYYDPRQRKQLCTIVSVAPGRTNKERRSSRVLKDLHFQKVSQAISVRSYLIGDVLGGDEERRAYFSFEDRVREIGIRARMDDSILAPLCLFPLKEGCGRQNLIRRVLGEGVSPRIRPPRRIGNERILDE